MRRVFFGLETPTEIKDRLLQVREEVAGGTWQSVEQLHLTSLFLGNLEDESLLAAREVARDIPLAAFELNVAGLGCFGHPHVHQYLWACVQPQAPIVTLCRALQFKRQNQCIPRQSGWLRPVFVNEL